MVVSRTVSDMSLIIGQPRANVYAMKHLLVSVLSIWLLAGCAQIEDRRREREVTPKKVGGDYTFKTWPGSTTTYTLSLQGVKRSSATLGPDFTVHYFSFEPGAALALYSGGHPRSSDDKATRRFRGAFGTKGTEWKVRKRDSDFRAETYVPDGDHSVWHLIIIAPTEQRVREIAAQLRSFCRHESRHAPSTATKRWCQPPGLLCHFNPPFRIDASPRACGASA